MEYVLAIDQGTTGSRAILYDKRGRKAASYYEEFTQYFPKPGWVEHDPEEIWASVSSAIGNVLKKIPRARLAAIGITNQRETTILWDRDTGRPVYNAIVWQCRRTAGRSLRLKKEKKRDAFFRKRTGLPIDAYFSATKIEWILKNIPGVLSKAKRGKILFGTVDSWLLWKLAGGGAHATDYTNASRTMIFNIDKLEWDSELLKVFGIPRAILPDVKRSSGLFAKTIKIAGLERGIPISGIAGDQQAALFGQECFDEGTIKNTYGTGCFMLLNAGKKRPQSKHGLIVTVGCGNLCEPVYVVEGAIFIAGAAVQWLRDGLKILPSAERTEEMARSVKDNGGIYFVPALVGLGAPYWDSSARGSIFGITRGTNGNHFARAALEAMCYRTKDVFLAMKKDTGIRVRRLKVDGGAAANNFLCQFQADILGIDVVRSQTIETTARGAAYLAGISAGFWKDTKELKKFRKTDRCFKPVMAKKEAERLYEGWVSAVGRTISR